MIKKFQFIRLFILGALLFLVFPLSTFSPAYAGISSGSSCSLNGGSFFGFPTWYKYLQGKEEKIVAEESIQEGASPQSATSCVPQFDSIGDVWLIVAAVISMLLYLGGIGAVIMVIYGGVKYTTSMGSPESTAQARNTIVYALVGLLIAISASFLITFVATKLGGT